MERCSVSLIILCMESVRRISRREALHAFAIHAIRRNDGVRAACRSCHAKQGNICGVHAFVWVVVGRHFGVDAPAAQIRTNLIFFSQILCIRLLLLQPSNHSTMTSLQCIQQHDDDERCDSSRCFETAAQYCSRYMLAVEQLEKHDGGDDFDSGSSGSSLSSCGSCDDITIVFKQSCGCAQYCWLHGQVIRFLDENQDNALIQVFAPIHMRYYNVMSASLKRSPIAFAQISLKGSQANVIMDPLTIQCNHYCYSYHPAADAVPDKKRKPKAVNQNGGKRRLSAAMVLLSPPPPKQQAAKDDDIDIDFDHDFAFMYETSKPQEPVADELNLDQCVFERESEDITEEELRALFNASSSLAATPDQVQECEDNGDESSDLEELRLSLPKRLGEEHCNHCDDEQ